MSSKSAQDVWGVRHPNIGPFSDRFELIDLKRI